MKDFIKIFIKIIVTLSFCSGIATIIVVKLVKDFLN